MMSIDVSCEIVSGGGRGLPYVCTSRAIDLGLLFNDCGPRVCSVELCGVGHRDSQRYDSRSEQEDGLRAWLRADRYTRLSSLGFVVHRITLAGCKTTVFSSIPHFT